MSDDTRRSSGLIIAGASSGSGKTSITLGLSRAIRDRGIPVSPFKIGPDYIDPGHLSVGAGKPCMNLDPVLMGEQGVLNTVKNYSTTGGLSLIEGVMGLYDGRGVDACGDDSCDGSTAAVAELIGAPVVVVIDARASAQTAGAVALGMKLYAPSCPVGGFIVNRVGSDRHYNMVRNAIEKATGLPVFGKFPKRQDLSMPERHLGLVPAWEHSSSQPEGSPVDEMARVLAELVEEHIDIDGLMDLAGTAFRYSKGMQSAAVVEPKKKIGKVKIGLAIDDAFHFYYQENLDILKSLGAELVRFSPVSDSSLPDDIGGIYFGGGYPELYAEALSANTGMREAVSQAAQLGMPIYAECGGTMYLAKSILTDGVVYPMVGVFPVEIEMGRRLSALGYYTGKTLKESVIAPEGSIMTGHMYRWSRFRGLPENPEWLLELEKGGETSFDGFSVNNTLGTYLHIHFAGVPAAADHFVRACNNYRPVQ